MKSKAMVAGHVCLDITPVFSQGSLGRLTEVLTPGKLIHSNGVNVHTGGAVANTGLAMKRLGAEVKLVGKVGEDIFGEMILSILGRYGVTEGMVQSNSTTTSYSIVLAPPGTDRIFIHSPGANDDFSISDIDLGLLEDVALFHFGYPPLMKKMYDKNGEELVSIFRSVKDREIATSLDMAAVDANSGAGNSDWLKILENVLPFVDFFVPSAEELCYMTNRIKYEEWLERANGEDVTSILSINEDIKPLADQLIEMGAKAVIIKCGAPGFYYRMAGKEKLNRISACLGRDLSDWANKEGFERSYKPEKVLSATGAGDVSIAAFLTAVLSGYDLEQCLKITSAAGACCVTTYDALSGLLSIDHMLKKIKNGWEKQYLGFE